MMKTIKLLFVAALLILTFSCRNNNEETPQPEPIKITVNDLKGKYIVGEFDLSADKRLVGISFEISGQQNITHFFILEGIFSSTTINDKGDGTFDIMANNGDIFSRISIKKDEKGKISLVSAYYFQFGNFYLLKNAKFYDKSMLQDFTLKKYKDINKNFYLIFGLDKMTQFNNPNAVPNLTFNRFDDIAGWNAGMGYYGLFIPAGETYNNLQGPLMVSHLDISTKDIDYFRPQ